MGKRFILISPTNWQLPFLYQLRFCTIFKIEICGGLFKRYLHENDALHTLSFYMKMNHFNIVFHMTWDEWQYFRSWGQVFWTGPVFGGVFFSQVQGPDPGLVFKRCRIFFKYLNILSIHSVMLHYFTNVFIAASFI